MEEVTAESVPVQFSDFSALEIAGMVFAWLALLALVGAFFYFFWWKMIRSYIQTPKELKGIRVALERIADNMEKQNDR